jgi:hypothetical protein
MEHPDPIHILLGAFVVLVALILVFAWGSRRTAPAPAPEVKKVWDEVALRLGGKLFVQSGDFRVRFKWHGRDAALSQGVPTLFQVSGCDFGKLKMELPAGHKGRHRADSRIEREGILRAALASSDKATAETFLSPQVWQLLHDLGELSGASVKIGPVFRVSGIPGPEAGNLVRFAVLCLKLAQHAKVAAEQTGGVRVVGMESSFTGQCQICGADLEGRLVRCLRCSTPHHADCWEYTGVCSTYGCGEKKFVA